MNTVMHSDTTSNFCAAPAARAYRNARSVLLALLVSLLSATGAMGQRLTVSAELSEPGPVFAGQEFFYRIVVEGASRIDEPKITFPDGLYPSGATMRQFRMRSIGSAGSVTVQEFSYGVSAPRPGRYVIPTALVDVGGRVLSTNPVVVEVLAPVEGNATVTIEAPDRPVYVGEPVTLIARVTLPGSAGGVEIDGPRPSAREVSLGQPFDRTVLRDRAGTGRVRLFGLDLDVGVLRGQSIEILVPFGAIWERPGMALLGPLTVEYTNRDRGVRERSTGDPTRIEILEPPLEGRPASFNGFVGRATIDARVNATKAKVGDPVRITLAMDAPMLADRLEAPDLSRQKGFEGLAIDSEGWRVIETDRRTRTFEIIIRPLSKDVRRIPAVEFSTFDPATQRYTTMTTEAFPIAVEDAPPATIDEFAGIAREPLLDGPAGVRANFDPRTSDLLTSQSSRAIDYIPPWAWIAILAVPPMVWAGLSIWSSRATPQRRAARTSRRAGAIAASRLRKAGADADSIAMAIRGYIGDRFTRDPSAMTETDCIALLVGDGVDRSDALELAKALAIAEAPRYAGASVSGAGLDGDGIASLIERLDRPTEAGRAPIGGSEEAS